MTKDISDEEFDKMLDEHFSNDAGIKLGYKNKLRWDATSLEDRKKFGKKSQQGLEASGYKIPKNIFDEIYYHPDMWGPRRGIEVNKEMAAKYNLSLRTIEYVSHGGDNIDYETRDHANRMKEWRDNHSFKFKAISPGVDRLDIYDANNFANSSFPPSLHYRAYKEHWNHKRIQEEIEKIGLGDCYFNAGRFRERYSWLDGMQSSTYEFSSIVEFLTWFRVKFNKPNFSKPALYEICEYPVGWRDPYTGWSFIKF